MRKIFVFFILLFVIFLNQNTFADSPLTSTPFYKAYLDNLNVEMVSQSKSRTLNSKLSAYLDDDNVSIVERLAVINALTWKFEGQSNFDTYLNFLVGQTKSITVNNYKKKCNANQLICLAYLKAMDNYFDVTEALLIADLAIQKDKSKAYSIYLIHGLIKAQSLFNGSWCKVYHATNDVRINKNLKMDMNGEAIKIVFDYMDLYTDSCK